MFVCLDVKIRGHTSFCNNFKNNLHKDLIDRSVKWFTLTRTALKKEYYYMYLFNSACIWFSCNETEIGRTNSLLIQLHTVISEFF